MEAVHAPTECVAFSTLMSSNKFGQITLSLWTIHGKCWEQKVFFIKFTTFKFQYFIDGIDAMLDSGRTQPSQLDEQPVILSDNPVETLYPGGSNKGKIMIKPSVNTVLSRPIGELEKIDERARSRERRRSRSKSRDRAFVFNTQIPLFIVLLLEENVLIRVPAVVPDLQVGTSVTVVVVLVPNPQDIQKHLRQKAMINVMIGNVELLNSLTKSTAMESNRFSVRNQAPNAMTTSRQERQDARKTLTVMRINCV